MIMSALQYPQIDMYWSEKWMNLNIRCKVLIKPIPYKERRTKAVLHLPEYGPKQSRCRASGCHRKTTYFF